VPEGYMFHFDHASSPRLIQQVILELVGPTKAREFWQKYRDQYITQADIAFLKKLGVNCVRVPFNFRLFLCEDHPEILLPTGFEMLDRVIRWCEEFQIGVILDMHCAPGGQTGDNIDDSYGYPHLFEDKVSQDLTIDLWKTIADRYANKTIVIGYDLLNEPIPHFVDTAKLNPLLEPLYKRIVAGIREVDQNHLIFLGGAQWDSNFAVFGPPFDSKLVYTFHKYWTPPTQEVIQDYLNFANKYNVPIFMGESGENTNEWIAQFRNILEQNHIGWCFWPYKKMDAPSCIVQIRKTPEFEQIITYAKQTRMSFGEIRKHRPEQLVVFKALDDFLHNCALNQCTINVEYIKALGFSDAERK